MKGWYLLTFAKFGRPLVSTTILMERILVIEDDQRVQKALRRVFECEGYKVEVCGDGRSALDAFRTTSPTAVILDLGLPVLSGKEVCRQIKQESFSLPVIVVSAGTDESERLELFELGAADYITKPFSPKDLLARVNAAIRRAQMQSAATSNNIHSLS